MKPRWIILGGLIAATTAAVSAAASSSAQQAPGQGRSSPARTFDLRFEDSYVDVGETGFTVGDPIVLNDTVLDGHGRPIGVQGGTCTITALLPGNHFRTYCTGAIQLPAGQITFQGLVTDAPTKKLAVTGGTGRYVGTSGTAIVTELGHDEAGTLRVQLSAHP